jgi:hypothetical protein
MVESVALKDSSGDDINPAKEDGTLSTIKDDLALIKADIDQLTADIRTVLASDASDEIRTVLTDSLDIADIETLTSIANPDLDGKKALVVASLSYGRRDASNIEEIRSNLEIGLGTNVDGQNALNVIASLYARQDADTVKPIKADTDNILFIKPTDGTDVILFDADDDSIAKGQTAQVVIVLNYVRNAGDTAWVPMTQP